MGRIFVIAHEGMIASLGVSAAFMGGYLVGMGLNAGITYGLTRYNGTPMTLGGLLYDKFNSPKPPCLVPK